MINPVNNNINGILSGVQPAPGNASRPQKEGSPHGLASSESIRKANATEQSRSENQFPARSQVNGTRSSSSSQTNGATYRLIRLSESGLTSNRLSLRSPELRDKSQALLRPTEQYSINQQSEKEEELKNLFGVDLFA